MARSGTLIVGQSGGPTAAINASLAGVLSAAREADFRRLLGMRFGIEGLLAGDLVDLTDRPSAFSERLRRTPSAILGSCRYRLRSGDVDRALEITRRQDAQAIVYIGGNDSADTSDQLHRGARAVGLDLTVVGVPKTIDNDLPVTDHCPGYGSAARFVAQATAEAGLDTRAMQRTDPIKLIEVMGRHAGWLAAAAWLARRGESSAPHLVYLPERPIPPSEIVADVERVYRQHGHCVLVLCENQSDSDGSILGAGGEPLWVDAFGHAYHDSPAQYLARLIGRHLGVRARVDKPGTIQRMSAAHHSPIDLVEAEACGSAAVKLAAEGRSGLMVTLVRDSDEPYRWSTGTAALPEIANRQRVLPAAFIRSDGRAPSEAFVRYARPLIGGPLPDYADL